MSVSVVSIYYIERRNDESRLLPDLSYVMVKVYFEFSRQMTYLVSTLFIGSELEIFLVRPREWRV